jgi:general secretion pathway protein D
MKYLAVLPLLVCTLVLVSCAEKQNSIVPASDQQTVALHHNDNDTIDFSALTLDLTHVATVPEVKPEPAPVLPIPYAAINKPSPPAKAFSFNRQSPLRNTVATASTDTDDVLVTVNDMELNRFIHLIFGQYLKDNYFVEPDVEKIKKSVTIYMEKPVSHDRFKRLISNILATYNVAVRQKDGMTFIGLPKGTIKGRQKSNSISGVYVGRFLPDQVRDDDVILSLIPINNLDVQQAKQFISTMRPLADDEVTPLPDNTLAVRARAAEVRIILDILEVFDRPTLQDKQLSLFKLQYIAVDKFITRIREILLASDVPVAVKKKDSGVRIIALPEISSALIISPRPDWIDQVAYWAGTLDRPGVLGAEPRIFIYRPKNCKALELADIIAGLFSTSTNTVTRNTEPTPRTVDHRSIDTSRTVNSGRLPATTSHVTNRSTLGRAVNVLRTDDLSITVDETRNALVIFTSPVRYEQILKNLKELDIKARQVMLEITIAEVTLIDNLQYGVEWYLRNISEDSAWSLSTLDRLALGEAGVLGLFSQSGGDFVAKLNLFAEDNLVNILATPRLVVLDNQTANFSVGTDVPVVTSEQSASDINGGIGSVYPSIMRNIEYRKTGIIVSVTPTIYSNGVLRLQIDASLSEAKENDISENTDSPLILDRSLNTDVILENGMYILLGGLISEVRTQEVAGIPLLMDIPVFGNAFKTTADQTTRTELIIQVRPTILDTFEKAKDETVKFRQLLRGIQLE